MRQYVSLKRATCRWHEKVVLGDLRSDLTQSDPAPPAYITASSLFELLRPSPLLPPPTLRLSSHQTPSKMHANLISAPVRAALLGGRFSSSLAPFAHPSSSTALYHSVSCKSQIRAASQVQRSFSTATTALSPSTRPQTGSRLPITYQAPALRANSTDAAAARNEAAKLDWNSFFKLRASRRRYTLGSSIVSSMASTVIGVQVLSNQDLEHFGAQVMGLDPFVVLGMATAACGAVGWLVGPFLGNAVWGLVYRKYKPAVAIVGCPLHPLSALDGSSQKPIAERERVLRSYPPVPC